jgi:hypothetical protein
MSGYPSPPKPVEVSTPVCTPAFGADIGLDLTASAMLKASSQPERSSETTAQESDGNSSGPLQATVGASRLSELHIDTSPDDEV